jgi:hypothetical protein
MFFDEPDISMSPVPMGTDGGADRFVLDATPIDLFDAWLFAEADVRLALYEWNAAVTDDKPWTHAAYQAALDREEQAARVLAARVGETS